MAFSLIQNKMFLKFSTEREFDSHPYMLSLGTKEWEPKLGEEGISLQCCVFMMCKHEDDLLHRDLCSRKIKKIQSSRQKCDYSGK